MDTLSLFTMLLASATFILAGASFWTIRQNYKFRKNDIINKAILNIRNWAEYSIESLTISSPSEIIKALEQIKINIQIIRCRSLSVLYDAENIGGEVKHQVQKTVHNFNDFTDKVFSTNSNINREELLNNILLDLTNLINVSTRNIKK